MSDNPIRDRSAVDIIFGRFTYGRPLIGYRNNTAKFICGNFCSISNTVMIYLGGNHHAEWVTTYPFGHVHKDVFSNTNGESHPSTKGDVIIGNDVWIADNVKILSGVKIGDGAIIANNSHVIKDVEPYSIVGGNPARFIKYRFSEEQIEKLLKIQWWNWPVEKINKFVPLLCSDNIDEFILSSEGSLEAELPKDSALPDGSVSHTDE